MRNKNLNCRHGNQGLTLVELLVVMAILSVVMMAVMSLYIPVVKSTSVQTQVSDVQSNLRLASKTMTRDLLIAGLLMPYDPIIFPDAAPVSGGDLYDPILDDPGTVNSADFTIRTRGVGNGFARTLSGVATANGVRITVTDKDMLDHFSDNSRVRLFEPVSGNEVFTDRDGNSTTTTASTEVARAYPVDAVNPVAGTIDINMSAVTLTVPEKTAMVNSLPETVVLRVRDANQPSLQLIQYRLVDGSLLRIVNGSTQVLARNVDTSDTSLSGPSFFDYNLSDGRVNRVDIKLTGKTTAVGNDVLASEKSRAVETSVKLRNIN